MPNILSLIQGKSNHDDIFALVMKIIFEGTINSDLNDMDSMIKEDLALDRMNQLIQLPTILDNILGSVLHYSIKQWEVHAGDEQFILLRNKPWSNDLYHSNSTFESGVSKSESINPLSILEAKHNEVISISIINMRVWDKAKWSGTLYALFPQMPIPVLGLSFKNITEALKIFNGWKKRLGRTDINDEVNVCIITGIDSNNPYHYKVLISPNFKLLDAKNSKLCMLTGRFNKMEPDNSINLDNFKKHLSRGFGYFLVPATFNSKNSQPEIADEKYWIKKNNIKIIEAWKIGENDIELMAISVDDTPIIPFDVVNAPVIAALKKSF